eukprot:6804-Amphidinium_carterae.1
MELLVTTRSHGAQLPSQCGCQVLRLHGARQLSHHACESLCSHLQPSRFIYVILMYNCLR